MIRPIIKNIVRPICRNIDGASRGSYWKQRNNLWVKTGTRSGLSMPNSLGGSPVNILPTCFKKAAPINELFDPAVPKILGTVFTLYIKAKLNPDNFNGLIRTKDGKNTAIQIAYGTGNPGSTRFWLYKANAVYVQSSNTSIPNELYYDNLWHDIVIVRNETTVQLYIDGIQYGGNKTLTTNEVFTYDAMFVSQYMFSPLVESKIYSTIQTPANAKSGTPDIDWFLFLGMTCINIISGEVLKPTNIGGDNCHYDSEASTWMLDHGYSLYKMNYDRAYRPELYLPYKADNTPATLPQAYVDAHYVFDSDHAGDASNHNCADSMLNIPYPEWDRSNVNLWNDLARVSNPINRGRYDSSNVDAWHISELDQVVLSAYGKSSRCYVKALNNSHENKLTLQEIIGLTENLPKSKILKALDYTGDRSIMFSWTALYRKVSSVTISTIWSSVFIDPDTDIYHMWGNYGTFPDLKINHLTSNDGLNWTEDTVNKPALDYSGGVNWDADMVFTPQVWKEGSKWYMLYAGANMALGNLRQIGLATADAPEGPWTKDAANPVYAHGVDGQWDDNTEHKDVQGIIKVGSTYYMFITNGPGSTTRKVGVATSTDLKTWIRDVQNPVFNPISTGGVNNKYFCPGIFKYAGLYYMIIARVIGTTWSLELFSCPNPEFHEDERTFIKTTTTAEQAGLLALDTPFVVTDTIQRDTLKNGIIMCYYSPNSNGLVSLSVLSNLELALTSDN